MGGNYMSSKDNEEFTFEILRKGFELGERKPSGYVKELNFVSFRGAEPKWDIREWNKEHTKMSKGVTLTAEEMNSLKSKISELNTENVQATV